MDERRNTDSWEQLERDCRGCMRCPLGQSRHSLVFGDGNPHARVMLIGEGPGEQEDRQGLPFVGPAGQLLDTMLAIVDLDRTKVYIANMVKCRPPHNRDPEQFEMDACSEWLDRQIKLVRPKIIVCVGRIAGKGLLRADLRITREHGTWQERQGIVWMATFHPSALLRDPSKRPDAFEDLMVLRSLIRENCPEVYETDGNA